MVLSVFYFIVWLSKMKKILYIVGLGGIGYAIYSYITKQVALALDWDYKIKSVRVNELTKDGVNFDLILSILNKSSFSLEVKNYDIDVYYADVLIGKAKNNIPLQVAGDTWFDVPVRANVSFKGKQGVLKNLGITLIGAKPLLVDLKGEMNVVVGKLPKQILLNVKDVEISENLSEDVGLQKPVSEVTKFLDKLGIKI